MAKIKSGLVPPRRTLAGRPPAVPSGNPPSASLSETSLGSRQATRRLSGLFLSTERVILRPMEEQDLDGPYQHWLNDYEVTRFLETGSFPSTPESLRRYYEQVAKSPDNVLLVIIDRATNVHIGNIKLGPIHPIHRRADMGIMIGNKPYWNKGYGREAIGAILDYGFRRLNLHKITLGVYADHAPAVRVYQQLGFVIEGTLKEHLFRDGAFHDKYVMGVLRADYERTRRSK